MPGSGPRHTGGQESGPKETGDLPCKPSSRYQMQSENVTYEGP